MKGKKIIGTILALALGAGIGAAACLIPANWDKITGGSQQEQNAETGPQEGTDNPSKPPMPTYKEIPYTIENGLITAYTGNATSITLPTSYSYDESSGKYVEGDDIQITGIKKLSKDPTHCYVTTINIPESYTTISAGAFLNLPKLQTIKWPKNITEIPRYCFQNCSNLKSFDFTGITSIGEQAFQSCIRLGPNITLPATLKTIEGYAFQKCALEEVTFEPGIQITEIPTACFLQNNSINSITLPEGVEVIKNTAFSECLGITSINLPNSLKKIDAVAFGKCQKLQEIVLPENVTEIAYNAFSSDGSSYIEKLTIKNSTSVITIKQKVVLKEGCQVIVSDNLYDAYMTDPNWNSYNIVKASEV